MNDEEDYTMKVPDDIQKMAMKIEDYFIERKIKKWKVMNVCSRHYCLENHMFKFEIENFKYKFHKFVETINLLGGSR